MKILSIALFKYCVLILFIATYQACSSRLLPTNAVNTPVSDEVNAAFSQTHFLNSSSIIEKNTPNLLSASADTLKITDYQVVPFFKDNLEHPVLHAENQLVSSQELIQILDDDPPVLVKKRLPFWKIAVGILLCLVGIGIFLYSLYGLAVLFAIALLLLAFGAEVSLLLPAIIGLLLLALLTLLGGIFTSVAGYNILLIDKTKRILFRRRKRA